MKNIELILFDLDDTLYKEKDFVKSAYIYINKYIREDSIAIWLEADMAIRMNPICPIAE